MCPTKDSQPLELCEDDHDERKNMTVDEDRGGLFLCWPQKNEVVKELTSLVEIVWPITMTSFLLYFRSIISMLFLGHLGDIELAGGSLAIAFANITGYSVMKGLAMGMEPICGQAFGAKKWSVLSLTFQKTLLLLLLTTLPVSFLWLNVKPILLYLRQDPTIVAVAEDYIVFSLPDLLAQAYLHPSIIFLRTQSITKSVTLTSTLALALHVPINCFLVSYMGYGVRGVALASSWYTVNVDLGLSAYLLLSKECVKPWDGGAAPLSWLRGWGQLVALAAPSVATVCLEWWWYEIMLIFCGLLPDPGAGVAAMGILIQTTGLIYVLPCSLSMGLCTRVSHELGARRPARARRAAAVGIGVAIVCGLAAFVFALLVRQTWGRMFTGEPKILALTSAVLPIVGLCELGNCPQTAGCGVLRGSARPAVGAHINFGSFYLIGLPMAVVSGFGMELGFAGLWLGLVGAQFSCACIMLVVVARTDWEVQAERSEQLTGGGRAVVAENIGDLEAKLLASSTATSGHSSFFFFFFIALMQILLV